jgi:predicted dehydrogenase
MAQQYLSRRSFLASTGIASFQIVAPHVVGAGDKPPPSETYTNAVIGLGRGNGFINRDGKTVAVCDVDGDRLKRGLEKGGADCKAYSDFREVIDRPDIDEIRVLTPPHWHALISIHAARAGKDVFCEKPLTRSIGEGRALVQTIDRYGCNFRYGAHNGGTPADWIRKAVYSGILGSPLTIYQSDKLGCNFKVRQWTGMVNQVPEPVPDILDWDMYLGPAPVKRYHKHRTHGSFRGYWDYDGGGLADMGAHMFNQAVPAMGKEHTSPVRIVADAPPAHDDAVGVWYTVRLTYADGTRLVLDSGCRKEEPNRLADGGRVFIQGPKGRLIMDPDKRFRTDPAPLLDELRHVRAPNDYSQLRGLSPSMRQVVLAHRITSIMNLANLAIRAGREIRFDPIREQVIGDPEANRMIAPSMRAPWQIYPQT